MTSGLRFAALVLFFCVLIILAWVLLGGFEGPHSERESQAPPTANSGHGPLIKTHPDTPEIQANPIPTGDTPRSQNTIEREIAEAANQPPKAAPLANTAPPGKSTVEGTVTVLGKKPARLFVDIEVTMPSGTVVTVPVVTQNHGSYIAERVPEGSARLLIDATTEDGARRTRMVKFEVRPYQRYRQNVDFGETGTIVGRFLGLREDESGAVLALAGAHEINAQSLDEIHELAAEAEAEKMVRPTTDGSEPSYRLEDLEAGTYTVIGLVDQRFSRDAAEDAAIWYTSDTVEVKAGQEVSLDIDLE